MATLLRTQAALVALLRVPIAAAAGMTRRAERRCWEGARSMPAHLRPWTMQAVLLPMAGPMPQYGLAAAALRGWVGDSAIALRHGMARIYRGRLQGPSSVVLVWVQAHRPHSVQAKRTAQCRPRIVSGVQSRRWRKPGTLEADCRHNAAIRLWQPQWAGPFQHPCRYLPGLGKNDGRVM